MSLTFGEARRGFGPCWASAARTSFRSEQSDLGQFKRNSETGVSLLAKDGFFVCKHFLFSLSGIGLRKLKTCRKKAKLSFRSPCSTTNVGIDLAAILDCLSVTVAQT